jgi:hypothetical protein
MRTTGSNAASPRDLHWRAAFTTKAYQTLSPVFWQHLFVSDTHMTNWSGGSSLFLNWAAEKWAPGRRRRRILSSRSIYFAVRHFKSDLSRARVGGESVIFASKFP